MKRKFAPLATAVALAAALGVAAPRTRRPAGASGPDRGASIR
ncbi:hypothetical protein [Arthrobacter sp. Br18]|nr:hypothetical protein [Arthrobacter sp. Br18]